MRIIKQSEFVALPAGVFYMHYEPCTFGDLRVKGDSRSHNDWLFTPTDTIDSFDTGQWLDRLDEMVTHGASYPLDFGANLTRHGMYDPDDSLIAVLDRVDAVGLIALLNKSLEVMP